MLSRKAFRSLSSQSPSKKLFSTSSKLHADFTHAVVGGGAVGLAIARQLQSREGASVVLIERHGMVGYETSSRNSEVIHAGIYYGLSSLKARLCIRGKNLLYELCEKNAIPYRNCGKWIVAQDGEQYKELEKLHEFTQQIAVPTRWVSQEEAKRREPDVRAAGGILESPTTGIVDSHSYMQFLHGDFEDKGGVCALQSPVSRVVPIENGRGGWEIFTNVDGEETSISSETFINSAGLAAIPLSNSIMSPERQRKPYYAKGTYFSYSASKPSPKTLIYPAPKPSLGGLGTHLTLDMGGRIRFGPDVEWIESPDDYSVNDARMPEALDEIAEYLPTYDRSAVGLDYAGIRPKLGKGGAVWKGDGKEFLDFYITKEEGFEGWINLLGIESPGLTSSLAIGEEVERLLYGSSGKVI
ncbi:FAD dependent oxidoreductase [Rhizodiscina lignyota]|uniref:L-2-hydroxyglutarate dehydrogenase, mitochondrial n=1 Tax=Rhizodiscina lignyota TaxID=1504668 RepID=A0A9P4IKS0_9PEZI|nr:FAD dependent oxidoreductase [Rhizodiscina lignyota]